VSQRAFLEQFDALAFGIFQAAGLADAAQYWAPSASAGVPCTVLVDRGVRDFGTDEAPVATAYTRITFQLPQVQPERGGRVVVEGETFVLDSLISADETASRWVAARG